MSEAHLHFRKSFPIIPGILKFTVSKRGVSLNLHLGFYSRSWGTVENRTTVDLPGHMGLGLQKVDRHGKHHHGEPEQHEGSRDLSLALIFLTGIVLLARVYLHPLSHCTRTGHPLALVLVIVGITYIGYLYLWHELPKLRGMLFVGLALALCYADWWLYAHMVASSIHCAHK